jgi:hypothetical protein
VKPENFFIRQNIRSDYCAVYATAMFLSLAGHPISRSKALELFAVRSRTWVGATHDEMCAAIAKINPSLALGWSCTQPTTTRGFFRVAKDSWRGYPTLVTAHCVHSRYGVSDWHAFVLVAVSTDTVAILDPLSRPPSAGCISNAEVRIACEHPSRRLHVTGAGWEIDLNHAVWFMEVPKSDKLGQ